MLSLCHRVHPLRVLLSGKPGTVHLPHLARRHAIGRLQRMARVFPQLGGQGWSGAAYASTPARTAPDQRSRGGVALAALAGTGHRADPVGSCKSKSLEGDLLGARDQPRDRKPALGIWIGRARLAFERKAGSKEEIHAVCGLQSTRSLNYG